MNLFPLYRAATIAAGPAVRAYLSLRRHRGKEDPARFGERLGRPGADRPDGPLLWLHGASVGEAVSMLPLIERLRAVHPGLNILITTGTVTSARLIADRLPEGCRHQYVPVDRPAYVRRFLDHWRPGLALWLESEFWPNLIVETADRKVPMVLVNGRVSPNSLGGWRRTPDFIRFLLSRFDQCLAQTRDDGERLASLGARRVSSPGNLKFAAPPLPAEPQAVAEIEKAFADRTRWLAASTHPGEESIAGRIHLAVEPGFPGLLTVVVPRHPERGPEVAASLARLGLQVARRGAGEPVTPQVQAYVADTMGEMGVFYRTAEVVFIGKSLESLGGQNPLEPARLDCAIVFGPHMTNFAEIAARLAAAGGAVTVADETELAAAVTRLLGEPGARRDLAAAARRVAEGEAAVLDAIAEALAPYLAAVMADCGSRARA